MEGTDTQSQGDTEGERGKREETDRQKAKETDRQIEATRKETNRQKRDGLELLRS